VASNTAPVKEFLSEGPRSRLVDFFDVEQLKTAALEMLGESREKESMRPMDNRGAGSIDCLRLALRKYQKLFASPGIHPGMERCL
jgi:hypothetical protein